MMVQAKQALQEEMYVKAMEVLEMDVVGVEMEVVA